MTGCKSGVNVPPRDTKLEPPFPCDPLVLPPARRGDLIFLLSQSQFSRVVVAQPTFVHAAALPFFLIPCAYPLKLQRALRTIVSERRLCKVETVVSTREGIDYDPPTDVPVEPPEEGSPVVSVDESP